ncbi:MAG TPA: lantibiotic dehydratase family protein, partial [Pyrinomonadaceae bacterium]|nr:lantibiotic dehydratase family protein [Pyrinomonadaceae bacterium]
MSSSKSTVEFSPAGFFVFRTPVLSFNEFLAWSQSAPVVDLSPELSFDQSYSESCRLLRERLYELISVPETLEAIFIACPDLIGFIEEWRSQPETKRSRNTERALVRYFSRMTGRPTPFGLFAGASVGIIGAGTRLVTEGRAKFRRCTRLDFDYLVRLAEENALSPKLRNDFTYRPNSSLYRAGGRIRYLESKRNGPVLSYQLMSVEETDYLLATLELATEGKKLGSLARALVDRNVSLATAEEFINLLIDSEILVPELFVPITGPDPLASLIDQLLRHRGTRSVAKTPKRTRTELARIDRDGLGIDLNRYQRLVQSLEHSRVNSDPSHLFHVELSKPAPDAVLGGEVLDEIIRGVSLLHRITPRPAVDAMTGFRHAFAERYEEKEVPLSEALDEETGIGFEQFAKPPALVGDLEFPSEPEPKTWDSRQEFLLHILAHALRQGMEEIVLRLEDIEKLTVRDPLPLSNSFAAVAKVAAVSQEALDRGEFRVLIEGVTGPSGAELFGRSCLADNVLRRHVLRYVRAERRPRPNAIFAEIVHLPEGRAGNIVARPVFRDFEIPYLGRSGARAKQQIPVSDLRISVHGEHVHLRSATLGREVIPRLTNAHDSKFGPAVYRFLSALQYQGAAAE